MTNDEQIKSLFRAYSENNNALFMRIAESIISNELAANHHSFATELKMALGVDNYSSKAKHIKPSFSILPKERRNGEPLISYSEGKVSADRIILKKETKLHIDRLLVEHRNKHKLEKYGYKPKSKILFWGPPGCGKTFTANHLAYELGIPIGIVKLNAVISSFLGDTANHLQKIFDAANKMPMVLLLDEVDAIAKNRDDPNDVGELKRVVNSLLQAMDLFSSPDSIVIFASNHQYLLDPAIWRRYDDLIYFPFPGPTDRTEYLNLLLNGVKVKGSIKNIAKVLSSISFAEIESITIETVKTMILNERSFISSNDIINQYRIWKSNLRAAQRHKIGDRK